MLLIAHEAPTASIPLVMRHTTLDFPIAHHTLEDSVYAQIYLNRAPWRPLIMDNGKFELTDPLSPKDVLKAAMRVKANYVIPPDHWEDFPATKDSFLEFVKLRNMVAPGIKLAPVCVGKTRGELAQCYQFYATHPAVGMICWAFGSPRQEAMEAVVLEGLVAKKLPHHLLGYKGQKELRQCFKLLKDVKNVSLDTSKPISAAHEGIELVCHAGDVMRGQYKRPPLDQIYMDEELIRRNIAAFAFWVQECWDGRKEPLQMNL